MEQNYQSAAENITWKDKLKNAFAQVYSAAPAESEEESAQNED